MGVPMNYQPNRNVFAMPMGQELEQLAQISKTLAACPFYAKMGPGGVLAVWLTAREMNLPVMACLNGGLYTFDGKVTMSAQLMNMMIVNAGHRADVVYLDETACRIRFVRCDRQKGQGDVFEYDFTIEMAQKAGYLGKTNWKASPRDMLYSRALSGGARKFMPDVLMNTYVFGEIEDSNFSDSHLVNVVPPIEPLQEVPKQIASEPVKQLESTKLEGYEAFVEKHGLEQENSLKRKYLMATVEKSNLKEIQVVNAALKNEKIFEERFIKWKDEHYREDSEM